MLGRLILNHLKEGNHQIENEPNVDHLYIGCLGEVLWDGYEHGCQNQHHGQVDSDHLESKSEFDHSIKWIWSYSLKEEGLEVVGHVGDGDEEQGGDVDGEDGAQQPSGKTLVIFGCLLLEDKNNCFLFELFENLFSFIHCKSAKQPCNMYQTLFLLFVFLYYCLIVLLSFCPFVLFFGLFFCLFLSFCTNLPSTTSTSTLPPMSRLIFVCL